jgi:hypothetical protein
MKYLKVLLDGSLLSLLTNIILTGKHVPGTIFTILYFLCSLQTGPISKSVCSWQAFSASSSVCE